MYDFKEQGKKEREKDCQSLKNKTNISTRIEPFTLTLNPRIVKYEGISARYAKRACGEHCHSIVLCILPNRALIQHGFSSFKGTANLRAF